MYESEICPYKMECQKFTDGACNKVERYKECGDYYDFLWEISGRIEDITKYIVEKLRKKNNSKQKMKKNCKNKGKKMFEKCPYQWKCLLIFEEECNKRRLNYECCPFECEDCDLNIPNLGLYCKTGEYEKCESYELISNLRREYEAIGVYNTKDLRAHFGEECYEWLGGYIKCAFMEPIDIK